MVFSGRPSTACHACRPVRRKCDRAPEGCSQCHRKGHDCPGYPDPTALRMRNETTRVTLKQASKPKPRPRAPRRQQAPSSQEESISLSSPYPSTEDANSTFCLSSLATFNPRYSSSLSSYSSPSSVITPPLHLSTSQQALSFLFHAFISATPFDSYLASFYTPRAAADANDACTWAIDAVALAAYGRHTRRPECADVASAKYAGALSRVNDALADLDDAALRDRTLVAVLVLALFEATAFFHPASAPTSWVAHTWGAMQLLMLRGPQRCTASTAARQLFSHTSNNIKASCIQRSTPIPSAFLALDAEVRSLFNGQDQAVRLAHFLHAVSALKARSRSRPRDPALLEEALQIDREIVAFCDNPPPSLRFLREPHRRGPAWTYRGIVHTYPNLRFCKVWNAVRLLRIFLLSLLGNDIEHFRVDEDLVGDPSSLKDYACHHMADVAVSVLATVPSFVYEENGRRAFLPPGRCLGWPLGILELSTVCPSDARLYARKTLEWLAEDLNLPQAIGPDRHPGSREDWLHLFHLG